MKKAATSNDNPQTGDNNYEELADGDDTDHEDRVEKSQDRIKQIDQFKDLIQNQSNTPRTAPTFGAGDNQVSSHTNLYDDIGMEQAPVIG